MVQLHVILQSCLRRYHRCAPRPFWGQAFQHLLCPQTDSPRWGSPCSSGRSELGAEQALRRRRRSRCTAPIIAHAANVGKTLILRPSRVCALACPSALQQGPFSGPSCWRALRLCSRSGWVHIDAGVVKPSTTAILPSQSSWMSLHWIRAGDVHAAGQDSGVAVGAALPGDKAQQQALCPYAPSPRGQVLRYQDAGLSAL